MANKVTRDFFAWSDDEVELLLKVTHEYKVVNAAKNTDWESVQNRYSDILDRFRENYPTPADAMNMGKDYPHNKDELSKVQLTTKVKAIRIRYRQALDSGKKSRHGRVVLLFFELCQSIWGGSPTTSSIRQGIETTGMAVEALGANCSTSDCGSPSVSGEDRGTENATSAETTTAASRRQRLVASLGSHRRGMLKRKLSMDSVAQEDLDLKRQLLQHLQATDSEFEETMGRWSSSIDRLNTNIEVLMRHIVGSRPMTPHSLHNQAPTRSTQPHYHSPVHFQNSSTPAMSAMKGCFVVLEHIIEKVEIGQ